MNNAVVSHLDLDQLFPAVGGCLRRVIQHDGSSLLLCNENTGRWRIHVLDFDRNENFIEEGRIEESIQSPSCLAITTGKPALFGERELLAMGAPHPAHRICWIVASNRSAPCRYSRNGALRP